VAPKLAFLGVPIVCPDGEVFGTICVLDKKPNEYASFNANSCCSGAMCCRRQSIAPLAGAARTPALERLSEGVPSLKYNGDKPFRWPIFPFGRPEPTLVQWRKPMRHNISGSKLGNEIA
jgi:hypothetical protein